METIKKGSQGMAVKQLQSALQTVSSAMLLGLNCLVILTNLKRHRAASMKSSYTVVQHAKDVTIRWPTSQNGTNNVALMTSAITM